MKAEDN